MPGQAEGAGGVGDREGRDAARSSDIETLRELIVGPTARRVEQIERRLEQPARVEDTARVLPDIIRESLREDADAAEEAARPLVEGAIRRSARKSPEALSDALFPVLGPAIRKSITHAIASMMQSLNQTLEHSFSARGLKWRFDAWRTGRPFAEVVLLNTLVYRVEQAFLIHRESGLLLRHVAMDESLGEDADVVSGMLTAVRDFARDAFDAEGSDEIESLRMGELELWVARGPNVLLALACRGKAPEALFARMQETVERIERRFGEELAAFEGDTAAFAGADDWLRALLESQRAGDEGGSPAKAVAAVAVVALALAAWMGYGWYWRGQWKDYVARVSAMPGVVVARASGGAPFELWGLRDPLADDPAGLLGRFGLDGKDVKLHWRPWQSLEPAFALRRARRLLQPPAGVEVTMRDGVLRLSGAARPDWIRRARMLAPALAGVRAVDDSALKAVDVRAELLARIRKRLTPPKGVELALAGPEGRYVLTARGEARSAWKAAAEAAVKAFPEVASYDDSRLIAVDEPARLLRLARKALRPPAGARLRVSRDLVLHVSGVASPAWKRKARERAAAVPYLAGYDDAGLHPPRHIPGDAEILAAAREMLKPPATVHLGVSQGVLTAQGFATAGWIRDARTRWRDIPGAKGWRDEALRDITPAWRALSRRVGARLVRYDIDSGQPKAGGERMLREVAEAVKQARRMRPDAVVRAVGLSQSRAERQKPRALAHARDACHRLEGLGVPAAACQPGFAPQSGSRRVSGVRFALLASGQAP